MVNFRYGVGTGARWGGGLALLALGGGEGVPPIPPPILGDPVELVRASYVYLNFLRSNRNGSKGNVGLLNE